MSDNTVTQEAAKNPNFGINIKFKIILKATVKIEKNITSFKNFSVDNITCTPGVAIKINGKDKESIFIELIADK